MLLFFCVQLFFARLQVTAVFRKKMNIRIAELEDLKAIVEIYNQAIAAGEKTADITPVTLDDRRNWFSSHTPDKYPILVAEEDELIAGYLSISAYRPGRMALRHTAEVSFFIHFDHHRKGIASCLLQCAIDMCPSLQLKTLFAILVDSNQSSIGLLEKYGFEEWGHMPRVVEFDGIEYGHLYYGLRIETNGLPKSFLECCDRVTALIRIIADDALHIIFAEIFH